LSACKSEPGDPEPPPELGGSPVGVGWLGSGLWTGFPASPHRWLIGDVGMAMAMPLANGTGIGTRTETRLTLRRWTPMPKQRLEN